MAFAETLLAPGDVLHETYRIERLIGVGGTGEVYLGENIVAHRTVAIKVLKREFSADRNFIELMRRELMHDINSDAVVRYYELLRTQQHGGLYFLVMEYIEGPSLAQLMEQGAVPVATLLTIGRRVTEGLRAAHALGVSHRDISPDNILLRDGDPARATLIDFGIAKDVKPGAGTVIGGGFAGKYEYAAPEQMDGQADAQSDIYALGATLLAAARGEAPPLPVGLLEIRRAKEIAPDVSDMPGPFAAVLSGMLAPARANRLADAAALAAALDAAIAGRGAEPGASPREKAAFGGEPKRAAGPLRLDAAPAEPPARAGARRTAARKGAAGEKKRRGLLLPIALVALLAIGGAAALLGPGRDLLAPQPPVADVYRFSAADGEPATATGHAPHMEARDALLEALGAAAGPDSSIAADLSIARGAPSDLWHEGVAGLLRALAGLENWRLDVVRDRAALRADAPDAGAAERAETAARAAAEAGGLTLDIALRHDAPAISNDALNAVLEAFRDCGPLTADVSGTGAITAQGRVSSPDAAGEFVSALRRIAAGRDVDADLETLNPYVCRLIRALPADSVAAGPLTIRYLNNGAESGDTLPADANPLVDVVVPADVDGYLYVVVADNEGALVNLLPNPDREQNRLSEIGTVEGGTRTVRVAYPLEENAASRIALTFHPPFGTFMVAAMLAKTPLFDYSRTKTESIDAYAPELAAALTLYGAGGQPISAARRFMRVRE